MYLCSAWWNEQKKPLGSTACLIHTSRICLELKAPHLIFHTGSILRVLIRMLNISRYDKATAHHWHSSSIPQVYPELFERDVLRLWMNYRWTVWFFWFTVLLSANMLNVAAVLMQLSAGLCAFAFLAICLSLYTKRRIDTCVCVCGILYSIYVNIVYYTFLPWRYF